VIADVVAGATGSCLGVISNPTTPATTPAPATMKPIVDTVPSVRPDWRSPSTLRGHTVPSHALLTADAFESDITPVTVPTTMPAAAVPMPT
jgi:hypothetical protein